MTTSESATVVSRTTSRDTCSTCRRRVWDPELDGPINDDRCHAKGSLACRLLCERNSMSAALDVISVHINVDLKSVDERAKLLTAMVISDRICPSSRSCPLCKSPLQVRNSIIAPHYPYGFPEARRLCVASFLLSARGLILGKPPVAKKDDAP